MLDYRKERLMLPIVLITRHFCKLGGLTVTFITPVPFVMAVALSAIIAFITPVGVPSTALVYSTGHLSKGELIKAGAAIALPTLMVSLLAVWLLPPP